MESHAAPLVDGDFHDVCHVGELEDGKGNKFQVADREVWASSYNIV